MQPPKAAGGCFNPHPARRPDLSTVVSILIRPEGRMQRAPPMIAATIQPMFQSSSGLLAGCNTTSGWRSRSTWTGFNPHPARRPDANAPSMRRRTIRPMFQSSSGQKAGCNWSADQTPPVAGCNSQAVGVSILIRPEGRMQLNWYVANPARFEVSILIRPEGRMQPDFRDTFMTAVPFQSSSGQKAGCNMKSLGPGPYRYGFNPHPARRPDATCGAGSTPCRRQGFQSSSGQKAGCRLVSILAKGRGGGFNPHPARRPDATPVSEFPICSARTS